MVSICGGEPLIYPEIEALIDGLHAQGRIVYLCTNATLMRRKMREYLKGCGLQIADCGLPDWERRRMRRDLEHKLQLLVSEELLTPAQAQEIRTLCDDQSAIRSPQ